MSYGTARGLGDVEAYYTHVRRGRPPTPELLQGLRERYVAIGGRAPPIENSGGQGPGGGKGLNEKPGGPPFPADHRGEQQQPHLQGAAEGMAEGQQAARV